MTEQEFKLQGETKDLNYIPNLYQNKNKLQTKI